MDNLIVKLVLIGALAGLGLGIAGNIAAKGALDYGATYNFPGVDENRINKDLEDNPNIPAYPVKNTILGGAFFGLVAGAFVGLFVFLFKAEVFYVLSALIGFAASGFIVSPYPFYTEIPPVANKYTIFVALPGMILFVAVSMLLEKHKPAASEEAVEEAPVEVKQEKPQGKQWHNQKKKK